MIEGLDLAHLRLRATAALDDRGCYPGVGLVKVLAADVLLLLDAIEAGVDDSPEPDRVEATDV